MDSTRTRRSRADRRQETRERVLDAAERVFARLGYHGASVNDIAEAAGYTSGALYSNFAGKEDLFLALLDRHLRRQTAGMAEAMRRDRANVGSLAPVAAPTEAEAAAWGLLTLEFYLYAMREPRVRPELASRYRAMRTEIGALLEGGTDEDAPVQGEDLATVVMGLSTGLGIQASLDPGSVPAELFERVMAKLTSAGKPGGPGERSGAGGSA